MAKGRTQPAVADAASAEHSGVASTVSLSALREQAAGLRRAQLMANLAHVVTAVDGSFESWSESLPDLIGVTPGEVVPSTRKWLDLIHPEDRARFRDAALSARSRRERTEVQYRLRRGDRGWIHVRQVMEPIEGPADGNGLVRWFNTLQDITALKTADERIRRLNRVYAVLSGINALIVRVRAQDELCQAACDLVVRHGNFRMAWIGLIERDANRLNVQASAGDAGNFFSSAHLSLVAGAPGFGLAGQALKSLEPAVSQGINSLCMIPLIIAGKGIGVIALYAAEVDFFDDEEMRLLLELAGDISFALENIEKSDRANYLAYYDPLTGLANRTLFHERLEQGVRATKQKRSLALTLLDIERFRAINDTFGRHAGDDLLRQIAARLTEQAGNEGWIARLGADVFAVVVPDLASAEELASRTAQPLREIFSRPYRVDGAELRLGGRLGIALYPADARDADQLVHNAEAALKKAKASGERYLFYEQRMGERVAERLALENQLRRALENDQFVLHYQPKVDLENRRIMGLEALIRWQSPELGLVAPMKFIPLLEESGLILPVGEWALGRAALDLNGWLLQGLHVPPIAVNVSAVQMRQRDFVDVVKKALKSVPMPGELDLEIAESMLMENIEENIAKLRALRELGVKIAIDDFGTGYSSLAYLAKLPVDSLKIDRSFIGTMLDDPNTMTLVQMIISLARSLQFTVVAEGVELEEQAKVLRLLHCDQMQGYLVSKPLPAAGIAEMLPKTRLAAR